MASVIFDNAFTLIDFIWHAAKEIREYVNQSKLNTEEEGIVKQIGILQSLLQSLRGTFDKRNEDPSEAMNQGLENLARQMKKCQEYCKKNISLLEVGINVATKQNVATKRKEVAKGLKSELGSAIQMLQLILQVEGIERNARIEKEEVPPSQIMDTSMGIGCYPVSNLYAKPPGRVHNVQAKIRRDRMELTWDYNGHNNDLREYEIHISQEGKPLPTTRSREQAVILCSPVIIPGKRYAFRIRPISKSGHPGDFSEEIKVRFLTAAPAIPLTPQVEAASVNEIEVTVTYPSEEECNGSPPTHCIIEYSNMDDVNCNKWLSKECKLQKIAYAPKQFQLKLSDLQQYCAYEIRVCFVNDAGKSPPSKTTTCKTLEPIPGPPTNFRFSSYRKANMIKLRWNVPNVYPHFAHQYEVEYKEKPIIGEQEWKSAGISNRFSLRVNDLSQDTRYYFRIRSVTANGQKSGWTHKIDETTRFSKLSKAVLTPLAFAGGTVGAPVIGAVGGTALAVEGEEKSAKTVAKGIAGGIGSTLACTLLAPVVGAVAVHTLITEGDEYSDQSDED